MKAYYIIFALVFTVCSTHAQSSGTTFSSDISKIKVEQKIKVFPNPATSVVNILGLKNSSKAEISIFDIYGNVVLSRKWEIRRNAVNIPISSLTTGAYIITIHSDEQHVRTKFYKK
ncbi:T9SS type A sorting domain-containing protein [Pseudozobellia sp. WGM2]|uniref:T9SS type A sorting domain-containing protein n=1 Tax=Pseudozobellia sp. WGM2 TaxID=2787625 RepID=UPI001ADF9B3B|nr:T9SS type A sorting domain-containing protein [Pseudozobellia sp. WGM2]